MAPMTVLFLGASTGVGLSALKHMLAAGQQCIAICRTPSKLTDIFSPESTPNLRVVQGNAHDVAAVAQGLKKDDGSLVDAVVTSIGAKFTSKMTIDDPHVCRKGMATLLEALGQARREGATGKPLVITFGTTGMSRFGRDVPVLMVPLYHILLKIPHEDKKIMEDNLVASGEDFTIIHGSLLTNGESDNVIRVGIEDPKTGRESTAIGYTISREDSGKWIAENLLLQRDAKYLNKIVSITY